MFHKFAEAITRLPESWFALAIIFLSIAAFGFTKVVFRQEQFGLPEIELPDYGLVIAAVLLLFGVLDMKVRGLIMTGLGAVIAAISGAALLALETSRWDVFVFALPLTLPGAVGLGMLTHGVLHASPAAARLGFKIIAAGFVASLFVGIVGIPWLEWRLHVHGTEQATLGVLIVAVLATIVGTLTLFLGQAAGKAERDNPASM